MSRLSTLPLALAHAHAIMTGRLHGDRGALSAAVVAIDERGRT